MTVLPWSRLPTGFTPTSRFWALASVAPITLFVNVELKTPVPVRLPLARKPIVLPVTVIPVTEMFLAPTRLTPAPPKFWNVTPEIVDRVPLVEVIVNPDALAPAFVPFNVSRLLPCTFICTVIAGRADRRFTLVSEETRIVEL